MCELVSEACEAEGANKKQALNCGKKVQSIFIKKEEDEKDESNDSLIFLSPNEIKAIAVDLKACDFDPDKALTQKDPKKRVQELEKLIFKHTSAEVDALDVALFGRMIAQAAKMNVEAAASFAHAISTHKVNNEIEFFSALDDRNEKPGAAHLGSLEYNSATYYRYISLDLGQLWTSLKEMKISTALEIFVKALYLAVPNARQATMSAASQWDYAKVFIRKGQRLQLSFEKPVKSKDGGYLESSIETLTTELSIREKRAGSLFAKEVEWTYGEGTFSIDDLIDVLKQYVQKVES